MFSYLHHIGDFNKATRHLSRIERSVYRDLIELYYETESPLQDDIQKLCRLIIANTKEEKSAVNQVLMEFFHLTHRGYVQVRCELEIEKFSGYINKKSNAGKVSAEKRKVKRAKLLAGSSTGVEQVLNGCDTGEQQKSNTDSTSEVQTSKPVNQLTSEPIVITPQSAPSLPAAPAKTPKATRLPVDWLPDQTYWDAAVTINPEIAPRLNDIAAKFKDYWISKSGKDATKADWLATWRNWIRREVENGKAGSGTNGKKSYGEQRSELFDSVTDYTKATNF